MSELEQAIRERFAALPSVVSVALSTRTVTCVTIMIDAPPFDQAPRDAVYDAYYAAVDAHPDALIELRLSNPRELAANGKGGPRA